MSQEISNQILEEIKKAENILLHLHVNFDPDSIGSVLGLYHGILKIIPDKKITIISGDNKSLNTLNFLPGSENILLKSYHDINSVEFDLFLILDSAEKHMIGNNSEIIFPSNLKTIIIDHHKTNPKFADINLIDHNASSASEIIFYLLKSWNCEIDEKIAQCLYLGIYGDTGGFSYTNTTTKTMEAVLELVKKYPNFPELIDKLRNNQPKERIYFDAMALSNVETFFEDKVALTKVSYNQMKEKGITKEHISASFIPNILTSVKEWKIGIILKEIEPNQVSVSLRSKGDIDVSKIAQELGGGGHKNASGIFLENSLEDAKEKVLNATATFLGE